VKEKFNDILEDKQNKRLAQNIVWYKKLFSSSTNPLNGVIALLISLIIVEILGVLLFEAMLSHLKEEGYSKFLIEVVDILFNQWSIPFLVILVLFFLIVLMIRLKELKGSWSTIILSLLLLFFVVVSVLVYTKVNDDLSNYEEKVSTLSEENNFLKKTA